MIHIKWIIFGVFTIAFIVGLIIHMAKDHHSGSGWFARHKERGKVGFWGLLQIVGYIIFLAIYGGVYWW